MKMRAQLFVLVLVALAAFVAVGESQVVPIKIAYATTSGIRLPLWIAEEAKLYEKYGLDAKLINIPSGNTAISALVSGEVDIVSGWFGDHRRCRTRLAGSDRWQLRQYDL